MTDPPTKAAEPVKKKRINTSKKGQIIELAAIKILEAQGYKVHRCVRTGAKRGPFWVSQSNDVFGCIDVVAKKKGEPTRWVQVTADGGIGRKSDEMLGVPWDLDHDEVEIWRFVGGRRGRKHKVTGAVLDAQYFQVYRLRFNDDVTEENPGLSCFSVAERVREVVSLGSSLE